MGDGNYYPNGASGLINIKAACEYHKPPSRGGGDLFILLRNVDLPAGPMAQHGRMYFSNRSITQALSALRLPDDSVSALRHKPSVTRAGFLDRSRPLPE